jgi:hypothetical protein
MKYALHQERRQHKTDQIQEHVEDGCAGTKYVMSGYPNRNRPQDPEQQAEE